MGAVAGAAVLVAGALWWDFLSDDAFITLRYARNWVAGHGIVFNPGERVEGYTDFLWMALLAGLHAIGADLVESARACGLLAGIGLVVWTAWWAARWPGRAGWIAVLPPILVAANSSLAAYAVAGLETLPAALALLAALWVAWREELEPERTPWSAVLFVLAMMTRPETAAVAVGIGALKAWGLVRGRGRGAPLARWAGVLVVGYGVFEAWRLAYYGAWLPNTFYAKTGGGWDQAMRGLQYTYAFVLDHDGFVAAALAAAAWLDRDGRAGVRVLTVGVLAWTAAIVAVGGDGLPLYRFFVPVVAPLALLAGRGLDVLLSALPLGGAVRAAVAAVVSIALVGVNADAPRYPLVYDTYLYQRDTEIPAWRAAGTWLRQHAPAGASFAAVPIGAVAYYSELRAIDMVGLTDAHIAHREVAGMGLGQAGHEKHDGAYVLGRRPTFLLLGNISVTPQAMQGGLQYANYAIYLREQDVVENPAFRSDYRFQSVPLGAGQWLNLYVRAGTEVR